MDDCRAVELLKVGNQEGLAFLVRQHYERAVYVSYLIVQDPDQAEDIVQSAFIHAGEKIGQLTSDHFGPWFLRMVVNASIKAAQKQQRQVSLDAQDETDTWLVEWLVDRRPQPEQMVETAELRQDVWQALARLTADQRAVVVMKYYLEMSEAEITRAQHAPLTTIKWRLHAARKKLRSLLRPDPSNAGLPPSEHRSSDPKDKG
jgi:RNA polymerase sigma-70 factor (ECF subfamily)